MFSGRRNSKVISRSSAQARSASDRNVISVSPDNWRLTLERWLSRRRASSCCVRPVPFSSVIALSNSLRTRPINRPAVRDRASISNRKNVIRRNSLHTQRRIGTQLAAQPSDRDAISSIQIMILDCVSPISEHSDEAIFGHEPTKNTNVRRFQFPDGVILSPDNTKLPCKDQRRTAQERMKKIVNLLRRRGVTKEPRRLCAAEYLSQPFNKLGRAIEQPQRLITRREFDLDPNNRSTVNEFCDGRHVLTKQRSGEKCGSTEAEFYSIFAEVRIVT